MINITSTILQVTKTGGTVMLVGMGQPEVKVPIIDALVREVDIKGVFRYVNEYVSYIYEYSI